MSVLRDPRAWSADRLHMTPKVTAGCPAGLQVMGVPVEEDWRGALAGLWTSPPHCGRGLAVRAAQDARWVRVYAPRGNAASAAAPRRDTAKRRSWATGGPQSPWTYKCLTTLSRCGHEVRVGPFRPARELYRKRVPDSSRGV